MIITFNTQVYVSVHKWKNQCRFLLMHLFCIFCVINNIIQCWWLFLFCNSDFMRCLTVNQIDSDGILLEVVTSEPASPLLMSVSVRFHQIYTGDLSCTGASQ